MGRVIYEHTGSQLKDIDFNISGCYGNKPRGGLWASRVAEPDEFYHSWIDWCCGENFCLKRYLDDEKNVYFELSDAANILFITSSGSYDDGRIEVSDANAVDAENVGKLEQNFIDWEYVIANYDGVELIHGRCYGILHDSYFYSWDCDSLCIWNENAVKFLDKEQLPENTTEFIEQRDGYLQKTYPEVFEDIKDERLFTASLPSDILEKYYRYEYAHYLGIPSSHLKQAVNEGIDLDIFVKLNKDVPLNERLEFAKLFKYYSDFSKAQLEAINRISYNEISIKDISPVMVSYGFMKEAVEANPLIINEVCEMLENDELHCHILCDIACQKDVMALTRVPARCLNDSLFQSLYELYCEDKSIINEMTDDKSKHILVSYARKYNMKSQNKTTSKGEENMEKVNDSRNNSLSFCLLTGADHDLVRFLDDWSGNYVAQWVNEEELPNGQISDYAFGILHGDKLVGYCTIGYADDVGSAIEDDGRHTADSLLLSDVYVLPEYRGKNAGSFLVSEAMKYKLKEFEPDAPNIYAQLMYDNLSSFYESVGFEWLDETQEYVMIGDREDILAVNIDAPVIDEDIER